jgi:hypothetical protein
MVNQASPSVLLASAGIWLGAGAWLASTQLNYALVPWACGNGNVVPFVALALALVAATGGLLSWRALAALPTQRSLEDPVGGQPRRLLGALGVALAALFGLVIVVQGTAALVLDGCLR